jgi:ABC-type transport system involved in multi-copper enzyme maturation permease subunit
MNNIIERLKKNILTQLGVLLSFMIGFTIMSSSVSWAYEAAVWISFVLVGYVVVFLIAGIINFIKDLW